jgi:CubicO group peptidase (beta-lactamase class C family)
MPLRLAATPTVDSVGHPAPNGTVRDFRVPLFLSLLCCALLACGDGLGRYDDLEIVTPEEAGMDPEVLDEARRYAFDPAKNTQGVVILRHGKLVAEWYADGRDADSFAASWSMAKSFTSALVGIALEEGAIPSLGQPVADYIQEWMGSHHEEITLEHLLTMSSGLDWNETDDLSESDVVALGLAGEPLAIAIDQPRLVPPGTVFNYSSGDTMLLSKVIQDATGMSVGEYAESRLFSRIGVAPAEWWRDVGGTTLSFCCLDMSTRDFARFGQLFLDGGRWRGEQVVPAGWVQASTSPSATFEGYGYQWWLTGRTSSLPEDTYTARGHDGQYVHVIPSLALVVVRNGLYYKYPGDPVADPFLFVRYPLSGLVASQGTHPPDSWDDVAFLQPVIDSIYAP